MRKMLQKLKAFISRYIVRRSAISMWNRRARVYGSRAVLNLGHSEEEIGDVTEMQKKEIFPYLKQELTGIESSILDFGCGPGRFTIDLANLIHGKAIGVDPILDFLNQAPENDNVEYRLMKESIIPVADSSIDVVWICLVLGGITKKRPLREVVSEVERILKRGGLIVLIENTTDARDGEYWKFRSVEYYQSLFGFAELRHRSDYYDLGERISIIVGRKHVQSSSTA